MTPRGRLINSFMTAVLVDNLGGWATKNRELNTEDFTKVLDAAKPSALTDPNYSDITEFSLATLWVLRALSTRVLAGQPNDGMALLYKIAFTDVVYARIAAHRPLSSVLADLPTRNIHTNDMLSVHAVKNGVPSKERQLVSLVRVAPIIYTTNKLRHAIEYARFNAFVTNDHPETDLATIIYASTLFRTLRLGEDLAGALRVSVDNLLPAFDNEKRKEVVRAPFDTARNLAFDTAGFREDYDRHAENLYRMGPARGTLESLAAAMYITLCGIKNPVHILKVATLLPQNQKTVATLAGSLVGATTTPSEHIENHPIYQIVDEMLTPAAPGTEEEKE